MFDPAHASLRSMIVEGKTVGVVWLSLGSVAIAEIAARSRPDAIVLDLQHGLWDRRDLEAAIGVIPPTIPVIARVAENSATAIGTALDAGAEAVMVPLIETADEARQAVAFAHYPPHGIRSGGGVRPLADFAGYLKGADKLVVILMIETAKGVANAAEIAGVAGVDLVFIGTGDLALSIGAMPASDAHGNACAAIFKACKSTGTPCGAFTMTVEAAIQRRDEGYRMVVTSNDMDVLGQGFAAATRGFASGG